MELRALLVPAPAPPNRNQLTSVSFIRSLSIPQARSLTFRRHPIAAKARCATGAPLEGAPVCFRCPPPKAPKAPFRAARAVKFFDPGATRSATLRACPWLPYLAPSALFVFCANRSSRKEFVMKFNLKINGRQVTWQLSDTVAVVPPPDFPFPGPEER